MLCFPLNEMNFLTFTIFIFSSLTLGLDNESISKLVDPNKRFFVITFGHTQQDTIPNFLFCFVFSPFFCLRFYFLVVLFTFDWQSFSYLSLFPLIFFLLSSFCILLFLFFLYPVSYNISLYVFSLQLQLVTSLTFLVLSNIDRNESQSKLDIREKVASNTHFRS
jgi:hypothetical protein